MSSSARKKLSTIIEEPGSLIYREGNDEWTLPVFEEDGEMVVVGQPSQHRRFLFFHWTACPERLTGSERDRIPGELLNYLRESGRRARLFEGAPPEGKGFVFFPELFQLRAQAAEALAETGLDAFSDYSSIDLLHEEYGLEVCGIRDEASVDLIAATLQATFPHWHHGRAYDKDYGIEPGWMVSLHMFRRRCCGDDWRSED